MYKYWKNRNITRIVPISRLNTCDSFSMSILNLHNNLLLFKRVIPQNDIIEIHIIRPHVTQL